VTCNYLARQIAVGYAILLLTYIKLYREMCVANVQVIVGAYISMDLFDVWDLVNAK